MRRNKPRYANDLQRQEGYIAFHTLFTVFKSVPFHRYP
jgi:hypothetical protein